MTTSESPIGFAIVGTGAIAGKHAEAIASVEGAELRAVVSRTQSRAEAFAGDYGCAVESTLGDLLKRPDIAVVCITTPTGNHGEIAIPALEAGKHVLCEKPLEINTTRIDAMLEVAEKHQRLLACVFQSRFGPGVRRTKAAIEAGRLGQLTVCNVKTKWWRDLQYYKDGVWKGTWSLDGGGALMNQGIHGVDLLQWMVGMPESVQAFAATLAHRSIETEDTLLANLRFPNGALGNIECATSAWPGFARTIEISGDRGSIFLEDDQIIRWEFAESEPEDEQIRQGSADDSLKSGASDPMAISSAGHQRHVQDLVQAIRTGRPVAIPGREGRNAVALIEAIYQSARVGRTVPVS